MDIIFIKGSLVFYLLSTFVFWSYLTKRSEKWFEYSLYLTGLGVVFHTISIAIRLVEIGNFPLSKLFESLSFFSWALIITFLFLGYRYKIHSLGSFVLPVVVIALAGAMMLPKTVTPLDNDLKSRWFLVHTMLSISGFVGFAVAFASGLMYIIQDNLLKKKKLTLLFQKLPPLHILDEINQKSISIGFPLLTLGIMSGMLWARAVWGSIWNNDPKMIFAMFTWFFYMLVLHGRYSAGWRSKKAAYLSVIGFVCVLSVFILITLFAGRGQHNFM